MASMMTPSANERKRVKVYELKHNDWFDRGTGFCTGRLVNVNGNVSAGAAMILRDPLQGILPWRDLIQSR